MTSPLKRVTDILDVRNFKRVKLMKQSASVLILKNYFFEKNGIFFRRDTIQANTGLTVHFNNKVF